MGTPPSPAPALLPWSNAIRNAFEDRSGTGLTIHMQVTAQSNHRVLKLSRTIEDLVGSEALLYRPKLDVM